jgi:hypothetical protein
MKIRCRTIRIDLRRVMAFQVGLVVLVACGEPAKFGGSPSPAQADATPIDVKAYRALTWYWQCETNPVEVKPPQDPSIEAVVVGGGDHILSKAKIRNTEMSLKGRLCPVESLKRDVVLVIDTSFSMSSNDPRAVDQCARLSAAKALLVNLPPESRFGIVTFNSSLASYSTGLYADANQLFNDLSRNRSLADALCANEGGTNYNAALAQAGMILSKGRPGATKEIYFVSDGQPDPGNDGVAKARELKGTGVKIGEDLIKTTIATVMLAGEDTVLESEIASKDPDGKALHAFAKDTSQLTSVLTSLSANEIVAAELRVKSGGSEEFSRYDVLGESTGLDFALPSITIDGEKSKQGIEVEYSYRDKRGNEFSTGGKLTWQESAAGPKSSGAKVSGP